MLEAIFPALHLMATVAIVVSVTAVVCRWLKWAPINITVNVIDRRGE
jgi:hypothetical protein